MTVSDPPGPRQQSIQELLYPGLDCFGCGPDNPSGLRLRSYAAGDRAVATFRPRPEHANGGGYLNGGIAATLLDCHSGAAACLTAHERGWLPTDGSVRTPYVTAGLDVRYRHPTPLDAELQLVAAVSQARPNLITVEAELSCASQVLVTGRARWMRLPG